jgi:hypothetical protein
MRQSLCIFVSLVFGLFLISGNTANKTPKSIRTVVSIQDDDFLINGKPTYPGRFWKGYKIEGLLINSRMVQGIFDDLNPATVDTFAYPDTRKWDADRNTNEFIAAMPSWRNYGLNSFSLNMQGGSPTGYGNFNFLNPGFNPDGSLMEPYMKRLDKILKKADQLQMVVFLGIFYFGQDQNLKNEQAIIAATTNLVDWLFEKEYRNVIIEINNETNPKSYDHEILKPERVYELVKLVRDKEKKGYRYLVTTSSPAPLPLIKSVVDISDLILFHANALRTTQKFQDKITAAKEIKGDRKMPIVINEDDNYSFESDTSHLEIAIKNHISWGYFDYRRPGITNLKEGYQSVPVDWRINSENKKAFFNKVKEITGGF